MRPARNAGDENLGGRFQFLAVGIVVDDSALVRTHLPRRGNGIGLCRCGVALREPGDLRVVPGHRALVAITQIAGIVAWQLAERVERVLPFAQLRFAGRPIRGALLACLLDLFAQGFGLGPRLIERGRLLRVFLLAPFE